MAPLDLVNPSTQGYEDISAGMGPDEEPPSLLDLPDLCLLAVMQHCADDPASLCSAAQAHSKLHQAATYVLTSITCRLTDSYEQQLESIALYIDKHGQQGHVTNLTLSGSEHGTHSVGLAFDILQFVSVQLSYLHLRPLVYQTFNTYEALSLRHVILDVAGCPGTPHPLKQLRLCGCRVDEKHVEDFVAALLLLPSLEHLSLDHILTGHRLMPPGIPLLESGVLQQLRQLTYLELISVQDYHDTMPSLQALTRLADLRLQFNNQCRCKISAEVLSSCSQLTHFQLSTGTFEPAALAGKDQLQHLALLECKMSPAGADGVAELLSQLQRLQQLTALNLQHSMRAVDPALTPASAFSALTASSRLQHLNISKCLLPVSAGVWLHLFSDDRQLLHLQSLDITGVRQPAFQNDFGKVEAAVSPDCQSLVRCCPGLRSLRMHGLAFSTGRLAPLRSLTTLHTLHLGNGFINGRAFVSEAALQRLEVVCQLTGLKELEIRVSKNMDGLLLLELAGLHQLTRLTYAGMVNGMRQSIVTFKKVPGGEPVWRQVLLHHRWDQQWDQSARKGYAAQQAVADVVVELRKAQSALQQLPRGKGVSGAIWYAVVTVAAAAFGAAAAAIEARNRAG